MAHCAVINLPDLLAINLTRNSENVKETRQKGYTAYRHQVAYFTVINLPDLLAINLTRNSENV